MDGCTLILLIDADQKTAARIRDNLPRGYGAPDYELRCAATLAEGLKLLAEGGNDVVLLDPMLPDSSGIAAIREVRAKAPDVPVVVLLDYKHATLVRQALDAGAQDYLLKENLDPRLLRPVLQYVIEESRLKTRLKSMRRQLGDAAAPD